MTPNRVMSRSCSSSVSVCPSRSKSLSSRNLLVGSASALNTRLSSSGSVTPFKIGDLLVTCQGGGRAAVTFGWLRQPPAYYRVTATIIRTEARKPQLTPAEQLRICGQFGRDFVWETVFV